MGGVYWVHLPSSPPPLEDEDTRVKMISRGLLGSVGPGRAPPKPKDRTYCSKVHSAFLTLAVAQGLRYSATQTHTSDRYEELETFILSSSQRIPAHLGRAQSALRDKQLAILETVTGFHLALMGRY